MISAIKGCAYLFQSVSHEDSGLYRCVAKGWKNPSFMIKHVDLVVQKDWDEVWANDTGVKYQKYILIFLVT